MVRHRTRFIRYFILVSVVFLGVDKTLAASNLTALEAKKHIGEKSTVCGVVAGVRTANNSKGAPTFINLDERYPHQIFTILIWSEDLSNFTPAPSAWGGKRVCATGTINSFRGIPEIVAKNAAQITFPQ